ncbi:MAG: virginiamycin B lyase family protein [Leptospirillum sp.]
MFVDKDFSKTPPFFLKLSIGSLLFLAACGGGPGASSQPALTGSVLGGSVGIQGSAVTLYAAGTGSPVSLGTANTSADGSFSIKYNSPASGTVLYVQAIGGRIGSTANPLIHLVGVAGSVGSSTFQSYVTLNEVSTVVADRAFYASFKSTGALSGSTTALSGALSTLQSLINTKTGAITVTGTTLSTLEQHANIVGACVNVSSECTTEGTTLAVSGTVDSFSILYTFHGTTLTDNQTIDMNTVLSDTSSQDPFPAENTLPTPPYTIGGTTYQTDTVVTHGSSCSPACTFTSNANAFSNPNGIAMDSSGNVWVINYGNSSVSEIPAGSTTANPAIQLPSGGGPQQGVAVDSSGNVWVPNTALNTVYEINGVSYALTEITGFSHPAGIAVDGSGNIWVANNGGGTVSEINGGTHAVTNINGFNAPYGIAVDSSGNIWVTDSGSHTVSEINGGTHAVTSITGFNVPHGIAVDGSGNIWVANSGGNSVSEIPVGSTTANTPILLPSGAEPDGIAVDGSGNIWVANAGLDSVSEILAGGTTVHQTFVVGSGPQGIAVDGAGNVWAANTNNSFISELIGGAAPTTQPIVDQTR